MMAVDLNTSCSDLPRRFPTYSFRTHTTTKFVYERDFQNQEGHLSVGVWVLLIIVMFGCMAVFFFLLSLSKSWEREDQASAGQAEDLERRIPDGGIVIIGRADLRPNSNHIGNTANHSHIPPCTVCLLEFEEGDECRYLPCMHFFHRRCIDTWISRSSLCPICRKDVRHSVATTDGRV